MHGVPKPNLNYYLAQNLTTGTTYKFRVRAISFNGEGDWSAEASLRVCTIPGEMVKPTKKSTSTSSITVSWVAPLDDGGCEITGYSVFVDDGENGDFVAANLAQTILTGNEQEVTNVGDSGKTYRIKVKVFNQNGERESPILGVVLASLPLAPPVPSKVDDASNDSQITIDFSDFPDASNGGSTISAFEVQMAIGETGSFVSQVSSLSTKFAAQVSVGNTYRFRYRA